MIDPKSGNVMQNPVVVVQGGRITSVGANSAIPPGAKVVDLAASPYFRDSSTPTRICFRTIAASLAATIRTWC
jgi:hypothetical protein